MEIRLKNTRPQYYILPDISCMPAGLPGNKCITVILYFYYSETLDSYMEYMNHIPDSFHIEIYSPSTEILKRLKKRFTSRKHTGFHIKENRGRDISALLVAARDAVAASDYVCFLHDKSPNAEYLTEDTERWTDNLWGNMLSDELYIRHVISLFEHEKDLGILFPPAPIGEYLFHWYGDTWLANYENTCKLAETIGLSAKIKRGDMPTGMGTVFWARGEALKKLYSLDWTYEMFPEEPLAADGMLNHAVERVLEYAAEDMGYKTGCIMTAEYASWLLSKAQEYARIMFFRLQEQEHVFNMHQIRSLGKRERKLSEYVNAHHKNYIYGAGNYGKALFEFLRSKSIMIDGFLVTRLGCLPDSLYGLPVKEAGTVSFDNHIGVMIGVSYETRAAVEAYLKECGFHDFIYGF